MGKLWKTETLSTKFEWTVSIVIVLLIGGLVYFLAPGLRVEQSKSLSGLELNQESIDNVQKGKLLALPTNNVVSTLVVSKPFYRIAEYAWNGNSGMIAALGGPRTSKGSIMESLGINLEIVRKDGVTDLKNMMLSFLEEYDKGNKHPEGEMSACGVSVMGDGGPFFVTTLQQTIDEKFGKGKYHVKIIAPIGLSYGEDKLIGPKEWKDNPQLLKGALIATVPGDGDHILACNFASANKIPINPDVTTYDPNAVNFAPSENDDYINSAKELVKSQKEGYTVPLKEIKDGKLTGKTINKKIDGCTTWTPGDKVVADAKLSGFIGVCSTKDFNNQMATTIITIQEFALENEKDFVNILKGTYTANNQIKLYDEWAKFAADAVQRTYKQYDSKYWYEMFKGEKIASMGSTDMQLGGTRVFNYADALQYYGISDGTNRYKPVYNQIAKYLTELNPGGFNSVCKDGPIAFDDAVNMYFLKSINDIDGGTTEKVDYSANKTEVLATGQWNINFATGSTEIQGSDDDLQTIYNLVMNAENTKLEIVGHTDNTGNKGANQTLSEGRANSVRQYLLDKGVPAKRFQLVEGHGDSQPVASNNTQVGKAKNRRVEIKLLK